ncbi:hypothetical protein PoB_000491700, partial [Plakobranchus ocellatus]
MNSGSLKNEESMGGGSPMGDIADILAEDGDSVDSFELMSEMNSLINDKPDNVNVAQGAKTLTSDEELLDGSIKKEYNCGHFSEVSAYNKSTEGTRLSGQKPSVSNIENTKTFISVAHTRVKKPSLEIQRLPIPSKDQNIKKENVESHSDCAKSESSRNRSSQKTVTSITQDYQEPSTSAGTFKSTKIQPSLTLKVPELKLNITPVVRLTRLAPGITSLKIAPSNENNKTPDFHFKQQDSNLLKKSSKRSVIKRSISSSSDNSNAKSNKPASSPNASISLRAESTQSDTLNKVVMKPVLVKGDGTSLERSTPACTSRFELALSPIVLADLSTEPFRKFMNLALDCATHFRKNKNQPLFGNVILYFGDFTMLRSAMQRLCQLPVVAHNMRINGAIKFYDLKKVNDANEAQPGKKCLVARLLFQYCAQRKEKLCELVSIKDRKKESTKTRSALINKVPASMTKEMLLLLFPFSIDVKMPDDKQQKGLKGPIHVNFESQEWMEAVLDCAREQAVNMSNSSDVEIGTFRLFVKNYARPKIPIGRSSARLSPTSIHADQVYKDNRVKNRNKAPVGGGRRTSMEKHDAIKQGKMSEQMQIKPDRKRSHVDTIQSKFQTQGKRRRFDEQKNPRMQKRTNLQRGDMYLQDQPGWPETRDTVRQAAIAKGLNPDNPDVIKILE